MEKSDCNVNNIETQILNLEKLKPIKGTLNIDILLSSNLKELAEYCIPG